MAEGISSRVSDRVEMIEFLDASHRNEDVFQRLRLVGRQQRDLQVFDSSHQLLAARKECECHNFSSSPIPNMLGISLFLIPSQTSSVAREFHFLGIFVGNLQVFNSDTLIVCHLAFLLPDVSYGSAIVVPCS